MQRNGSPSSVDDQYISIPSRVGWDLSFVDFPIEIQPYMQGNLALGKSRAFFILLRGLTHSISFISSERSFISSGNLLSGRPSVQFMDYDASYGSNVPPLYTILG
jgi:hypothetical protein